MAPFPELYVLRHGETEWNRQGRWQGALDSPLTAEGRAQAVAMGRLLADLGVGAESHQVFSSPQGRAVQTTDLALPGAARVIDPRLAEIGVGTLAGLTRDEILAVTGLPADAHFLDHYRAAPSGEGFESLFARVSEFLSDLTGPAVIVTHGITSRFLRTAALGWGLDRIEEVPGGQGVIHRVRGGWHETLVPEGFEG